jgi:hypothetical protein
MQTFTVKGDHAGLRLRSRKQAVRRAQDYFSKLGPKEQLWSEELIQDRRKEAARERGR